METNSSPPKTSSCQKAFHENSCVLDIEMAMGCTFSCVVKVAHVSCRPLQPIQVNRVVTELLSQRGSNIPSNCNFTMEVRSSRFSYNANSNQSFRAVARTTDAASVDVFHDGQFFAFPYSSVPVDGVRPRSFSSWWLGHHAGIIVVVVFITATMPNHMPPPLLQPLFVRNAPGLSRNIFGSVLQHRVLGGWLLLRFGFVCVCVYFGFCFVEKKWCFSLRIYFAGSFSYDYDKQPNKTKKKTTPNRGAAAST